LLITTIATRTIIIIIIIIIIIFERLSVVTERYNSLLIYESFSNLDTKPGL